MPVTANATLLGGVFATLLAGVISEYPLLMSRLFTLPTLFFTLVALILMIFLANRKHHLALAVSGFKSPLLSVFYRDGIFYFICLSGTTPSYISQRHL